MFSSILVKIKNSKEYQMSDNNTFLSLFLMQEESFRKVLLEIIFTKIV